MTTPEAVSRKEDDDNDDDDDEEGVAPEGDDDDIPFATPILGSWLYVGAEESVGASQRKLLVERGVSHVVSVMKHPPPWLVISKGKDAPGGRGGGGGGGGGGEGSHLPFEHLHVKVEDTKAANLSERFAEISAFIARAKENAPPALRDGDGDGDGVGDGDDGRRRAGHGEHGHGRIIVHCAFGWSRSVTAVAAHLVACEGFTLGQALERIRSRRPKACPNPSFLIQLVQHEVSLRGAPSDLRGKGGRGEGRPQPRPLIRAAL